jgi:hypothetical protein
LKTWPKQLLGSCSPKQDFKDRLHWQTLLQNRVLFRSKLPKIATVLLALVTLANMAQGTICVASNNVAKAITTTAVGILA